jgi:glycosyltransferase involved in cell wall biosynthesis
VTKGRIIQCIASLHEAAAGTTVYLERLLSALAAQGVDAQILTTGPEAPAIPARYFPQDQTRLPVLPAMRPSAALRLGLVEEARTAAAIHSHGLWLLPNVYPGHAARHAGIPLIVSPHGMLGAEALQFSKAKKTLFWHLFQRRAVAGAACWHATSEKEAHDIRAFGIKAPIAVIPIGIDLPTQSSRRREKEVLFLGRLHAKKGLDALLRVWPSVAASHPDWTLRIVGPQGDAAAATYRATAERMNIPNIRFEDAAYGDRKWDCYRRTSLFVLPTRDENFGIVVAEALAAETPVICSDGAPWSALVDHNAGWWIPQTDAALGSALVDAIRLPDETRRAMGARGREWMARDFAWQPVAAQMAELYAWAAQKGSQPNFIHA